MAEVLSPEEIAGVFFSHFLLYWNKLNKYNTGTVSATEAAKFLKLSGLPNETLKKIWELSDRDNRGCLDRQGLFTACKLVALCQSGKDADLGRLLDKAPLPKFRSPVPSSTAPPNNNIPPPNGEERRKYESLFLQLQPVSGLVSGDKVKELMLCSRLPVPLLAKIWAKADSDRDGHLDLPGFTLAMHLVTVHCAREGMQQKRNSSQVESAPAKESNLFSSLQKLLHVPLTKVRETRTSCVICVGSTGSGKSSTVAIVTGK